jgi:hypothetical protein
MHGAKIKDELPDISVIHYFGDRDATQYKKKMSVYFTIN